MADSQQLYRKSFEVNERDSDILSCLGIEQNKTEEDIIADALGLYVACSKAAAERPGGMFAYVADDSYVEITTGIPGEATDEDSPMAGENDD